MAKLEKASDEIIEFITGIIEEHDLDAFATFRFFELPKQKELIKVSKASATTEYFAKASDMCTVFINPNIWNLLEETHRRLLVENALNGITYDDEKMKMNIEQPDLMISSECYAKYGKDLVDAAEIAANALRQLKEKEKAEKEAKKQKKEKKWTPEM